MRPRVFVTVRNLPERVRPVHVVKTPDTTLVQIQAGEDRVVIFVACAELTARGDLTAEDMAALKAGWGLRPDEPWPHEMTYGPAHIDDIPCVLLTGPDFSERYAHNLASA